MIGILFAIVFVGASCQRGVLAENRVSLASSSNEGVQAGYSFSIASAQREEAPIQLEATAAETVFTKFRSWVGTFKERILRIDTGICGNSCGRSGKSKCQVCHCDTKCFIYDNCCPGIQLQGNNTNIRSANNSDCVPLVAAHPNPSDAKQIYGGEKKFASMITKCPGPRPNNGNAHLEHPARGDDGNKSQRLKCQQPNISNPDEAVPVTDVTTQVTYRNIYCAKCNHVNQSSIEVWSSEITCDVNGDVLLNSAPSKRALYESLISVDGRDKTGCKLTFFPTRTNFLKECRLPQPPIIQTCNETGQWREYSSSIEEACGMYTSLFDNKYKNMFCFLCNTNTSYGFDELTMYVFGGDKSHVSRLSFSALIDFTDVVPSGDHFQGHGGRIDGEPSSKDTPKCQEDQVHDNQTCSCLDVKCSEVKRFMAQETKCDVFVKSNTIGFRACVKIEVKLEGVATSKALNRLMRMFSFSVGEPTYRRVITVSKWCEGDHAMTLHIDMAEMALSSGGDVDALERSLEDTIFVKFCGVLRRQGPVIKCEAQLVGECPDNGNDFSSPCHSDRNFKVERHTQSGNMMYRKSNIDSAVSFMTYQRTNRCPFMEIPKDEFRETEVDGDGTMATLEYLASGNRLPINTVDFVQNGTVIRMCLEDFFNVSRSANTSLNKVCDEVSRIVVDHMTVATSFDNMTINTSFVTRTIDTSFDTMTIAGLISTICSCISLFFLLLTFLTYVIFDQLRSGGGKNIMMLTVVLFIALALYEFTMEQYENETLCSCFGVLIHFFWLAAIFSMNACTVERFYKLCFPLRTRSFFMSGKPFFIATTYTFTCPLLIVILNMALNFAFKEHIGYGNPRLCYINERLSRIFAFVVPMCAIVLLNVVLLVITIAKLRRQSDPGLVTPSQTRIGLMACVRLSVVTGFTWLFSLLYEAAPSDALEYVLTALIGLQGVVFFFSLIVNRRVLEMFRKMWSSKLRTTRSSSIGSSSGSKSDSGNMKKKKGKDTRFIDYDNKIPRSGKRRATDVTSLDSDIFSIAENHQ